MSKQEEKKHGNTGNSHAVKDAAEKVAGDKIFIPMPAGSKARIIKWREAGEHKNNASALRSLILDRLEKDGF